MLLNPCQAIRYSRFAWSSSAAGGQFAFRNSQFEFLRLAPFTACSRRSDHLPGGFPARRVLCCS